MAFSFRETVHFIGRSAKRVAVAVVGGALVLAGIAMIVLPGPGPLVIFLGLGVLATEFAWAHRAQELGKEQARKAIKKGRSVLRRPSAD